MAYSPLLQDKGAATWGHTREQALDNIREVLQMPVASMQEYGEHVPDEPATDVRVFTEPQVAVAV